MTPMKNHAERDYGSVTPKQRTMALYEKGVEYRKACEIAGYNPHEELRRQIKLFFKTLFAIAAVSAGLLFAAEAITEEQKQLTDSALASCLNGTGMIINGELWICSATGIKGR